MKHVTLPGGEVVPSMGQGTWKMGERAERRSDEIAALRAGVELGMTLVDTAEMYGDGAAETLICEALGDRRDQLFLVSKAYPQNASRSRLAGACEASLKRLGTDRLDLYLLHWRGSVPLAEMIEDTVRANPASTRTPPLHRGKATNIHDRSPKKSKKLPATQIQSLRKIEPLEMAVFRHSHYRYFWGKCYGNPNLADVTARWPTESGARRVDDRRMISGIVHMLKWGGCWADFPA